MTTNIPNTKVSGMSTTNNPGLVLNIVPVTFSSEKLVVGRVAYTDEDKYKELRERHWLTHAFRFDSRTEEIFNVALVADISPIGQIEEVDIQEHLLLVAKAIQHSILIWLAGKLPILKGSKQLVFWGQADQALLLSQAVKKAELQPLSGLEVPLRYKIDCRLFSDADDNPFLGMIIDVGTANVIDIPVSDLMQKGMLITDRYVCHRKEFEHAYLHPGLELLGRVSSVQGTRLLLTDVDNITEIEADKALLEPRLENLEEAIQLLYGPKSAAILSTLHQLRQPILTTAGKLSQIRTTLASIKKRGIKIAGVNVEFGDLLKEGDSLFPSRIATERPTLLFGPQGRNVGQYPDLGIRNWGPFMYMQHTHNAPLVAVICESRYRGRVEQFMKSLSEGFPDELWANDKMDNPFVGGLIGKFRLSKVRLEYEECAEPSAEQYRQAIKRLLERVPATPDLALVQTRKAFRQLRGDDNPYFVTKAAFMTAGVPTQAVHIENIDSAQTEVAYLLNNVALASYAKLDGTPWVISTRGPTTHELVMGIGSAEVSQGRLGSKSRYVGITTVFQGDGRYLVWELTREAEFEEYATALLESLRTVISHVKDQNSWQKGDKVRLICHAFKRLKNCEVDAIKALVQELVVGNFQVEFAFLDISWSHPYQIFNPVQKGVPYWSGGHKKMKGKGLPDRGLCLQLDRWRALLHLTGPKDIKTDVQGLPRPLLVDLHSDSDFTDLAYLLRQIYHFTYISWQSFFPATEPVTIKYSHLIARLLGNLKTVKGWNSTVLSVGGLRGRRWFL